ncbi:MAG: hypothetical protein IRZ08_05885, partial [Frankia sp.]|nr:hypothetical protein [Frankia sp.]
VDPTGGGPGARPPLPPDASTELRLPPGVTGWRRDWRRALPRGANRPLPPPGGRLPSTHGGRVPPTGAEPTMPAPGPAGPPPALPPRPVSASADAPPAAARPAEEFDPEATVRIKRPALPPPLLETVVAQGRAGQVAARLATQEDTERITRRRPPELPPPGLDPRRPSGAGGGGLTKRLPAGLLDSSMSSLASFLMGFYATRYLSGAEQGVYALFYTCFMSVAIISANSVFTPAELSSTDVDRHRRADLLPQSLRLGLVPAVFGAALVPLVLLIPTGAPMSDRVAFAATATLLALISPLQDHIRRMLHQSGRSWHAARVSGVQLGLMVVLLSIALIVHVPAAWVPFGAMTIARLLSGIYGYQRAVVVLTPPKLLTLRGLLRSGTWIAFAGVVTQSGAFINTAIVAAAAGSEAAGQAEAARVLAQPVTVLVVGLLAVLNPELMTGTKQRDFRRLVKILSMFWALVGVAIVGWAGLFGFDWPWNPLPHVLPRSYEVSGLLPFTIFAEGVGYSVLALITIVIAAGRERESIVAAMAQIVVSAAVTGALAASLGPFALVWGGLAGVVALYVGDAYIVKRAFFPPAERDPFGRLRRPTAFSAATPVGEPAADGAADAGRLDPDSRGGRG